MTEKISRDGFKSIEDNYPDYLEDSFGYGYDFFDQLSQQDLARHDALCHADAAELQALGESSPDEPGLKALSAVELFGVVRGWYRLKEHGRFVQTGELLLATRPRSPLIDYAELARQLAWEHALTGNFQAARTQVASHLSEHPDDVEARQLAAIIEEISEFESGRTDKINPDASGPNLPSPLVRFAAEFPQDAEIRLEFAEDLYRLGHQKRAIYWLNEAKKTAQAHDPTTLVDIQLVARRLFPDEGFFSI